MHHKPGTRGLCHKLHKVTPSQSLHAILTHIICWRAQDKSLDSKSDKWPSKKKILSCVLYHCWLSFFSAYLPFAFVGKGAALPKASATLPFFLYLRIWPFICIFRGIDC